MKNLAAYDLIKVIKEGKDYKIRGKAIFFLGELKPCNIPKELLEVINPGEPLCVIAEAMKVLFTIHRTDLSHFSFDLDDIKTWYDKNRTEIKKTP